MGKQFFVHSRHDTMVPVEATTEDGHKVVGQMPASIIELIPVKGGHATVTLTEITPTKEDADALREVFIPGAIVELGAATLVKAPDEEKE